MKRGIGITTFSSSNTSEDRYLIIEDCFKSISNYVDDDILVVIVNDGSVEKRLLSILDRYKSKFNIIHKEENGGISKAKNTCIKYLYDNSIDLMFLIDDDILVKRGFMDFYESAIIESGLDHFSYMVKPLHTGKIESVYINGCSLVKSDQLNGCLITITRRMVDKIGYFKVLPNRYGHEHTEYTIRSIRNGFSKRFLDVYGSERFVEFHQKAYTHQSEPGLSSDVDKISQNSSVAFGESEDYTPFKD